MSKNNKIKIYLKSGNSIIVEGDYISFLYDEDKCEYISFNIENSKKLFDINPSQIEAWEEL